MTLAALGTSVTLVDGEDCEEAIGTRRLRIIHRVILIIIIDVGLTINVIAPANVMPGTKLPVAVVCSIIK